MESHMNIDPIRPHPGRHVPGHRLPAVLLAGLALAVSTAAGTWASPAAAAAPSVASAIRAGICDPGHVCIYKGDIWDDTPNHPKVYDFYRYGTYNVAGLVGDYTVLNCQTGGAGVKGYTGRDGTGKVDWNLDVNNCNSGLWTSLTKTNSVRLYA